MGIANVIAGAKVGARYARSAAGAAGNTAADIARAHPKTTMALGAGAGVAEGAALLGLMGDGDGPDAENPAEDQRERAPARAPHPPVSMHYVGHEKVRIHADVRDPSGAQFAAVLSKFGYRPAEMTEGGATYVMSKRELDRVQTAMAMAREKNGR